MRDIGNSSFGKYFYAFFHLNLIGLLQKLRRRLLEKSSYRETEGLYLYMSEKISLKDIAQNLLYSFISFAMPTAILQFLIQPLIAKSLGAELNGQYLAIMSFHYFMIGITATVLNNVRLLQQKKYDEQNLCGDFNIFFLIYVVIAVIVVPVIWYFFTGKLNVVDILLMEIIAVLYIYHDYVFAEYRLKLQYNKILINNILMTIGYIAGWFLLSIIGRWQIVFIVAYSLPTIFDLNNTTLLNEPVRKTPLFKQTAKQVSTLTCSHVIGSVPTYCDKVILYPILGGSSVSVYHSASIVGKLLLLVSSPLNSVLLSYLVRIRNINKKNIIKKLPFAVGILFVAYIGCVVIGYPLINFLYPEWAEQSRILIPITVAASMFNLINGFLNTIVLRFCKLSYQIILQIISLTVYLVLSLISLNLWDLWGFCIATVCAALIKTLILLFVIISKKIG